MSLQLCVKGHMTTYLLLSVKKKKRLRAKWLYIVRESNSEQVSFSHFVFVSPQIPGTGFHREGGSCSGVPSRKAFLLFFLHKDNSHSR